VLDVLLLEEGVEYMDGGRGEEEETDSYTVKPCSRSIFGGQWPALLDPVDKLVCIRTGHGQALRPSLSASLRFKPNSGSSCNFCVLGTWGDAAREPG
jgi:hypothetical protein